MTPADIYFYWDAAFGPEVLSRGAGDADFNRVSESWREDRRQVWRPVPEQTPRVRWLPPKPQKSPRVAVVIEPARTFYPRQNTVATGWTVGTAVDDTAPITASGLLPLVPNGQARLVVGPATSLGPSDSPADLGDYEGWVWRRRSTERFYEKVLVQTAGTHPFRVSVTVPDEEEWYLVLPTLEAYGPTSPWPMPAVDSDRDRTADTLEWVTYLPPETDFYLHHEWYTAEGLWSLGTYFGPIGFATVLRKPDGTVLEADEAGLPPLTIVQEAGWAIKLSCDPTVPGYFPATVKIFNPRGFVGDYDTLEGFLAEAERTRLGPGGLLISDIPLPVTP